MLNEITLSRFTPSLLTQEALEAIFVQREALAERLVDNIRVSATTPNKHYALLVGQRGIGKTHLVSLIYHRVQADAELQTKLRIAWLREEEWGVASYLDLLRSILRALEEANNDERTPRASDALHKLSIGNAEREAERLLMVYANGATILIIAENLDDIFDALEEEGQQKLRALIQNNPVFTILATTRGLFGSVTLRESPFYGFFDIHHLKALSVDDAIALLAKIARQKNDNALATLLNTAMGRARIRAVHYLVGGNPRLYIIFSQFLTHDSLEGLVAPVMQTLDDLTSYYQERMARLSPQQRKIIQFLCDRRGAIPVKVIAEQNFISHQTTSSQLKKLTDVGYVHSEQRGRESYYELIEPLMRISLSVKKYHGESVGLLVDFLRLWYSQAELNHRLASLGPDAIVERRCIHMALEAKERELAESLKECQIRAAQRDYMGALQKLESLSDFAEDPRIGELRAECLRALRQDSPEIAPDDSAYQVESTESKEWLDKGCSLSNSQQPEEALLAFDRAIQLDPENAAVWIHRGTSLAKLCRYSDAIESYGKGIQLGEANTFTLNDLGIALLHENHLDKALSAFDRSIKLDSRHAFTWNCRGRALSLLERHEDALRSHDKALDIDPNDDYSWICRGQELADLGRHTEALTSYDKALELQPNQSYLWYWRAETLAELDRYQEALADYEKALEWDADSSLSWIGYGSTLSALGNDDDALAAYDRALIIEPTAAYVWRARGRALTNLGRTDEAFNSYTRAIEIEPDNPYSWNCRGKLYVDLGMYDTALESFLTAVEKDPNDSYSRICLGDALFDLGRLDDALVEYTNGVAIEPSYYGWLCHCRALLELERYEEALQSISQSLKVEPEDAYASYVRGNILMRLSRPEEAACSYQNAVRREPDSAAYWCNYGVCLNFIGRQEEALKAFRQGLELDPADADLWMNQSIALVALGQYREALDSIEKASALGPEKLDINRRAALAVATMFLGEWDRGKALLNVALTDYNKDSTPIQSENSIVQSMFLCTQSPAIWRQHIRVWIEVFSEASALNVLGQWLGWSIRTLNSPQIGIKTAKEWLSVWNELGGNCDQLALPIRLLQTAVEYQEEEDDRVLFQLPLEERRILESILGIQNS